MIDYYLLTKPGIIFGNLVTFAAGFILASRGSIDIVLFITTLLGLAFIIASACVFNNYIDRFVDKKMERTKERALVMGRIKTTHAIGFAVALAAMGNATLLTFANPLATAVANVGFLVYVLLYSFLKCKTSYSTLIGSVAGAVPPVVGYCAVSNRLDLAAAILFLLMVLWQMPHFYAIALWHFDDYAKAEIPVLPVCEGARKTKIHMALYIMGLIPTVALLTYFSYTGILFAMATLTIGVAWLALSFIGFNTESNAKWGKQMFRLSLVMINAICIFIAFDLV